MLYLDTSVVLPLFVNEDVSAAVKKWAAAQRATMTVSEWVNTEFVSALALKVRTGVMSNSDRSRATGLFDEQRSGFRTLSFESRFFVDARNFIADYNTGLRASDALHLAIAASVSATLCTRDRRFAEAATQLGRPVEII